MDKPRSRSNMKFFLSQSTFHSKRINKLMIASKNMFNLITWLANCNGISSFVYLLWQLIVIFFEEEQNYNIFRFRFIFIICFLDHCFIVSIGFQTMIEMNWWLPSPKTASLFLVQNVNRSQFVIIKNIIKNEDFSRIPP